VSFLDELDSAAKKFKELAEISDKRFKDTKASLDKLKGSDPAVYANSKVVLLKKLRPEIEKESERIYYERQKANKKIEDNTPAVDYSIPLASKGVETEQMKRKETEKAKKEQMKKEVEEKEAKKEQGGSDTGKNARKCAFGAIVALLTFPAITKTWDTMVEVYRQDTMELISGVKWAEAVERAGKIDTAIKATIKSTGGYFARVGPGALNYVGKTAAAGWTYATTFTATAETVSVWSVVWPVVLFAAAYEVTFRPQDIEGVIDRAGDKLVKRQEYNLKIADVARYETMCEVNQRKIFALVKDINLEQYIAKYEKLGVKISEGKEIANILKKVPKEAKLYLATKLYEAEENVKATRGEDFTSSPVYLKFVLKNLKQ